MRRAVGSEPVVPRPPLAPARQGPAEATALVSQAVAEPGSLGRARRQRAARAAAGRARTGAGGAGAGVAGAAAPAAPVSSRIVRPRRTTSPTSSGWGSLMRTPFTNVPLADPRSSMLQRRCAVPEHARVTARELRIVAEPSLPAFCTPDHELVVERDHAALCRSLPHQQLRGRGGAHLGGRGRPQPGRLGNAARSIGHLQHRLAHAHDVADLSVRTRLDRSPFTNVPFDDPRSSIVSSPPAPRTIFAHGGARSPGRRRAFPPPRPRRGR